MTGVPATALTADTLGFTELITDGDEVWWVELRPEQGRALLVAESGRTAGDVPGGVGSRVHEYGGSATLVVDGVAYWVDHESQRIWSERAGAEPLALVPEDGRRYGELELDAGRSRLLAVCEDHRGEGEPENLLVAVPLSGGEPAPLLRGRDFYGNPRVSPDGQSLAYVCWGHPHMPWDAAEVHLADLDAAGAVTGDRHVTGSRDGSAGNPQWSADGVLHLVLDREGWWNLHVLDGNGSVRVLVPEEAEHGGPTAGPGNYDIDGQRVVVASRTASGSRLQVVDRGGGRPRVLDLPLTQVHAPRFSHGRVVFLGGSATTPLAVWSVPVDGGEPVLVRAAGGGELDRSLLAEPESLTAPSRDGQVVHGYYYPPLPAVAGAVPLLVGVHGGPVAGVSTALQFGMYAAAAAVYWTSRGYGYLEMAYRGTTGYGRAYREALYGRWGELEVDDVLDVVQHLVDRGDVDPARVGIRGGSAGGWTVLSAVTRAPDAFAAGTAYFPVSDLVSFHSSTHKFESRYDESLIGPYEEAVYRERSPLTRVGEVRTPLLFLQGEEDRVCPPEQSELFVDALRALGRPVEYRLFPGEGHGFVRAESIVESLEREEAFYAEHLGAGPAGPRDETSMSTPLE